MIRSYLSDLTNKHKTHGLARYHSGNKSWIEKTLDNNLDKEEI